MSKKNDNEPKKKGKAGMVTRGRQAVVILSFVTPSASNAKRLHDRGMDTGDVAVATGQGLLGIDHNTGGLSLAVIKDVYLPAGIVLGVDTILSKAGVYKRLANLFRR